MKPSKNIRKRKSSPRTSELDDSTSEEEENTGPPVKNKPCRGIRWILRIPEKLSITNDGR